MGGFWGGAGFGALVGSMFGALVVGSIWARDFLRRYKDQCARSKRSEDREARALAILEIVNKEEIRRLADDIDKTTELRRSRPLDV